MRCYEMRNRRETMEANRMNKPELVKMKNNDWANTEDNNDNNKSNRID